MRPEPRTVRVGALRTRVLEARPEEREPRGTVVLVHAYNSSAEMWLPNLAPVASRYRVLAPDLLGHGMCDKPDGADYSMRGHARFLADYVDAEGLASCSLVGASMGGLVAGLAARDLGERAQALVLVGAAGLGRLTAGAQKRFVQFSLETMLHGPSEERLRRFWERNLYHDPGRIPPEAVKRVLAQMEDHGLRRPLVKTGRSLWRSNRTLRAALPLVSARKAFFWGAHDAQFPLRYAERAAAENPGSELVVFPACGHVPNLERPREFNEALLAYLDRVTAPAVREREAAP